MGERRTVLLIDNDRDVAEIVRAVLTDEGYDVAVLSDLTPDAIAGAVGRLEPDAVLLDGEGRHGYGTSWDEAINLAQRERAVPVVMFSADVDAIREATEVTSDRSVTAHLSGVIRKPFELDDLLREVAKAVGRADIFDRSAAADETRTAALADELAKIGAMDIHPSARREWGEPRAHVRPPRGPRDLPVALEGRGRRHVGELAGQRDDRVDFDE